MRNPQYYDPWDPEEQRRRREALALDSPESQLTPEPDSPQSPGINPESYTPDANSLTRPVDTTPQDREDTTRFTLSPAQEKYKQALGNIPNAEAYKPSKWRRLAAALAGGFTGIRDPRAGISVAQSLVSGPFEHALGSWERQTKTAGQAAGVEERAIQEMINERRAAALERSAVARERSASATEAWRHYQEQHEASKWFPHNEAEAIRLEQSKHAPPRPPTYGGFPTMEDYIKAQGARPYTDPIALEAERQKGRVALEGMRYQHNLSVARLRASITRQGTPATPEQQNQAEHLAAQKLVRENPEYAQFYQAAGTQQQGGFLGLGGKQVSTPAHIKTMDEAIPKSGNETRDSLAREKYRQFLSDLDKEKRRILGNKTPQDQDEEDDYEIQQQDEEDQ